LPPVLAAWSNEETVSQLVPNAHRACDDCRYSRTICSLPSRIRNWTVPKVISSSTCRRTTTRPPEKSGPVSGSVSARNDWD
jgi:hypothetical protein